MRGRLIDGGGDIAVATEHYMKDVGTGPLSKELGARAGQKQKLLDA